MTYRGHVENGMIRLEDSHALPDGLEVEVRLLAEEKLVEPEQEIPSLYDRLIDVVGKAKGLPPDASSNVDHYLYGQSKR